MSDNALQVTGNGQFGNLAPHLGGRGLPPSLQILFNDGLYDRVKQLAGVMAKAVGVTPSHLLGKPEACFAIINIALDARLNPHFVARHTYQTPGGQIGHDGALVQATLETSGKFIGSPQFDYVGDWSKVSGKFEKKVSQKGNEYIRPDWTPADAAGLGVIVRWQVRDEGKPRVWPGEDDPFLLTQCYPLNSPLWATDPKTQIAYLAIRRFANIAAPGILGAAAFDEGELIDASDRAIDVTPQSEPRREDFVKSEQNREEPRRPYEVTDLDGQAFSFADPHRAAYALRSVLSEAARQGLNRLDGAWESNEALLDAIDPKLRADLAGEYADTREAVAETAKRDQERRTATNSQDQHESAGRAGDAGPPTLEQASGRVPQASERLDRGQEQPQREGAPSAPAAAAASAPKQSSQPGAGAEPDRALGNPPDSSNVSAAADEQSGVARRTAGSIPATGASDNARPTHAAPAEKDAAVISTANSPGQSGIGEGAQSSQQVHPPGPAAAERPEPGQGDPAQPSPARGERHEAGQADAGDRRFYIEPPLKRGGSNKPDYRAWSVALFRPKLRRWTDADTLPYLLGDNEANLDACRNGGLDRDEIAGLEADIKAAWERCK